MSEVSTDSKTFAFYTGKGGRVSYYESSEHPGLLFAVDNESENINAFSGRIGFFNAKRELFVRIPKESEIRVNLKSEFVRAANLPTTSIGPVVMVKPVEPPKKGTYMDAGNGFFVPVNAIR
jgi:hypothetical protein